jgi:hypothetical protein
MHAQAEFDICTSPGRGKLAQHHIASDRQDQLTTEQIINGLADLVNFLGLRDWMIWSHGGFVVPIGHRSQRLLNVVDAVELGQTLRLVSRCDGFSEFLKGFANPTQFDDTFFEARIARWCLERATIKKLRFAPMYRVLGRAKRPDFEIQTPIGWLVCECKRLHLHTHDSTKRLTRITDAFDAAMQAMQIQPDMRLEVTINRAIHGDLRIIAEQACHKVRNVSLGTVVDVGPFSLRISPIGSEAAPSSCLVQQGKIRVGNTPTGITPEYHYLRVLSPWIERAVVRTIGAVINAAHRQLPHDRASVIFIEGPSQQCRQAAETRLIQPEYAHCLAIASVREGEVVFSRRNTDEMVVDWLFLGKVPSLSSRLRYMIIWRSGLRVALLHETLQRATLKAPGRA